VIFNDQTNDESCSLKIIENAKIAKISDNHQTRTSFITLKHITVSTASVASQKAESQSSELESSESNSSSNSDALSERLQ